MKSLTFPKAHGAALVDDLFAAFPEWVMIDPETGERSTDVQISGDGATLTLTVPDDADEATIAAVVNAHTPPQEAPIVDLDALRAELTDDPLGVGYAALTDAEAAATLNAKTRPGVTPRQELLALIGIMGIYGPVKRRATMAETDVETDLMNNVLYVVDADIPTIDLTRPELQAMLGGLVAFGVLTEAQAGEIAALAQNRRSRAEELGWPDVPGYAVWQARQPEPEPEP